MDEQDTFDRLKCHIAISTIGTRCYYIGDAKLHREGGPAVEFPDGAKYWYINGLRHRLDGPAMEYPDGFSAWYINGIRLTEEEFLLRTSNG